MHRIGLALSGGGFRATLFHLGMIRFLREANILPNVTHITSVSGGSILAAHLVLNWHRYTDSLKEFDAAAAELIRFVQLDIRNRVLRRYPLAMPIRALRWLTRRRANRQLTRTGLLEYHYQNYLYGDTCLFQLPERPKLYILATNLSEGCLCAFTRDGLLMQRRGPGQHFRFDQIHTGLATVPMAVTASSAFPGFFPPLELQGQDVGADPGRFGRLAFTDGGVYDNLGVRMFRCLERSWMARDVRLQSDDLTDVEHVKGALLAGARTGEDSPIRRLAQLIARPHDGAVRPSKTGDESTDRLVNGLWHIMNHENLARDPAFAHLAPPDSDAIPIFQAAQRDGGNIEAGELLWLNRQLIDAAIRQATGKPCFRSLNVCFDSVLVSDAGMQIKIENNARAGGLVSTAMRASDILMDRVWQLETDTFSGTPGFVFVPISKVVDHDEDPTALHPEVQRMSANIRTDLDCFSPLEISTLIRHGYCVGRSVCRSRPDLFGESVPMGAPWDPLGSAKAPAPAPTPAVLEAKIPPATPETEQTRSLQQSASRRLWSTLLDYRDWTSYIYVPLLVPILFVLPYYLIKWYNQAQVTQHLLQSMAQSSTDFKTISKLLQEGPAPQFEGMQPEEVRELKKPDYAGIEVIADTRVIDFRPWHASYGRSSEQTWGYSYRRLRIQKREATANRFVVHIRFPSTRIELRTLNDRVPATLRLCRDSVTVDAKAMHVFELDFDISKITTRDVIDLPFEFMVREPFPEKLRSTSFLVDAETGLLSFWFLLPEGKQLQSFDLLRYSATGAPVLEPVIPASQLKGAEGKILAFSLLNLNPGYNYECRWTYRD